MKINPNLFCISLDLHYLCKVKCVITKGYEKTDNDIDDDAAEYGIAVGTSRIVDTSRRKTA